MDSGQEAEDTRQGKAEGASRQVAEAGILRFLLGTHQATSQRALLCSGAGSASSAGPRFEMSLSRKIFTNVVFQVNNPCHGDVHTLYKNCQTESSC